MQWSVVLSAVSVPGWWSWPLHALWLAALGFCTGEGLLQISTQACLAVLQLQELFSLQSCFY